MNIYIEQLKDALDKVEITSESAIKLTYEDGINDLVKVFKAYKTSRRGVYFCGNGGRYSTAYDSRLPEKWWYFYAKFIWAGNIDLFIK